MLGRVGLMPLYLLEYGRGPEKAEQGQQTKAAEEKWSLSYD